MKNSEQRAVILQQIALNKRMYDIGAITEGMHNRTDHILHRNLTKYDG